MLDTFIVHKEWLDNISGLPVEQQDKIIGDFVRYGVGLSPAHIDDEYTQAFVKMLKNRIDYSKDKYNQKVEMSRTAGRKKKIDDKIVWDLAQEGKKAAEIAELLGCSKSTIEHSPGWKYRKSDMFEGVESPENEMKIDEFIF